VEVATPPPSSAKANARVGLYLNFPLGLHGPMTFILSVLVTHLSVFVLATHHNPHEWVAQCRTVKSRFQSALIYVGTAFEDLKGQIRVSSVQNRVAGN
jgi:hypothetical protein